MVPDPNKALIELASDAMASYQDQVRVDMTARTLEAFIDALSKLPKNEIRLKSIQAVGYERSTKHLIFFQA